MVTSFKSYLAESDIRTKYALELIDDVVKNWPGTPDPTITKKKQDIASFLASQKTFGNKTIDKLVDDFGLSYGLATRFTKEYKDIVKTQLGGSGPALTSAQRIARHLKDNKIRMRR